jgi:hypothetical protein
MEAAKKLCQHSIQRRQSLRIYQIEADTFNVITTEPTRLHLDCENQPMTHMPLEAGSSLITLPFGCSASTKDMFVPRTVTAMIKAVKAGLPNKPIKPMSIKDLWLESHYHIGSPDQMIKVAEILTQHSGSAVSMDQIAAATAALTQIKEDGEQHLLSFGPLFGNINLSSLMMSIFFWMLGLMVGSMTLLCAFNQLRRRLHLVQATLMRITGDDAKDLPPEQETLIRPPSPQPPSVPDRLTPSAPIDVPRIKGLPRMRGYDDPLPPPPPM